MKEKRILGEIYEFCKDCKCCPVAIEVEIQKEGGLEIKDDFGGSVKLTDRNLRDFSEFLAERFGK